VILFIGQIDIFLLIGFSGSPVNGMYYLLFSIEKLHKLQKKTLKIREKRELALKNIATPLS
jgi:hypothetical protein